MTTKPERPMWRQLLGLSLALFMVGCGPEDKLVVGQWVADRVHHATPAVIDFAANGTFELTEPGGETLKGTWHRTRKTVSLELAGGASCTAELHPRDHVRGLTITTCTAPGMQKNVPYYFLPKSVLLGEARMRLICDVKGMSATPFEVRTFPDAQYMCFDYRDASCRFYFNAGIIPNRSVTWFQRERNGEFRYEITKRDDGESFDVKRSKCLPSSTAGTCTTDGRYWTIGRCSREL